MNLSAIFAAKGHKKMYVVISGEKGEGKTTELLRLCATHLKEKKTVVFLTTKEDYDGFASTLEEMGAKDLKHYYRPMYAKDLQSVMEVAHRPYDVIALDGYSKLEDKQYEELMKLTNERGVIISTSQKYSN